MQQSFRHVWNGESHQGLGEGVSLSLAHCVGVSGYSVCESNQWCSWGECPQVQVTLGAKAGSSTSTTAMPHCGPPASAASPSPPWCSEGRGSHVWLLDPQNTFYGQKKWVLAENRKWCFWFIKCILKVILSLHSPQNVSRESRAYGEQHLQVGGGLHP